MSSPVIVETNWVNCNRGIKCRAECIRIYRVVFNVFFIFLIARIIWFTTARIVFAIWVPPAVPAGSKVRSFVHLGLPP